MLIRKTMLVKILALVWGLVMICVQSYNLTDDCEFMLLLFDAFSLQAE